MSGRWAFFVEDRPWEGVRRLFMRVSDRHGHKTFVNPLVVTTIPAGAAYDTPTLIETQEETLDNLGDVTGFLQAALEAAWELGMRPKSYADHTNEIKAVRYHLEDMRALAKVPPRPK